jgi:redox-sensitive bicupin YhaK (pirin superfamily)
VASASKKLQTRAKGRASERFPAAQSQAAARRLCSTPRMSANDTPEPTCAGCAHPGVALVIEGRPRGVGGIEVARLLPVRERRAVGPFVFLDHMGPAAFPPGKGFDVPPHPHIGLSTVTYLLEGEAVHRDSLGSTQTIRPGEINLMTAGRGIVHSERSGDAFRARGGILHGLQLWLALPAANEEDAPSFSHHDLDAFPSVTLGDARARVLLGEALGAASPIAHPSLPVMIDAALDPGATLAVPPGIAECAVYVVEGEVAAGALAFERHRLLVCAPGAALELVARRPSRVVLVGGPPLDGKRFMDWNFVSSSRDRIDRAREAWRAQTFPRIPGDDQEYTPLPSG